MRSMVPVLLPILLLGLAGAGPVSAQVVLQGAVSDSAVPPPVTTGTGQRAAAPSLRPPGEDAVSGRDLVQSGSSGSMRLEGGDKTLRIVRLSFKGDLISSPGEACQVDVPGGAALEAAGRPAGVLRYKAALPMCPITLDILDGAVSVSGEICAVTAADCSIDPSGLWGPPGGSIRGDQLPRIERARRQADEQTRASFKALLAATKDKTETKRIASGQAGFSSRREEVCTHYQRESVHGFCAARLTEARAFALRAELDRLGVGISPRRRKRRRASPRRAPR
ncbi:MAG: uncharacterized protein JWM36_716 [Hyphomicrobiales bacterium]|nr:uncharacterized protein [Hyphomicrobiales bacterium]